MVDGLRATAGRLVGDVGVRGDEYDGIVLERGMEELLGGVDKEEV